MRSNSTCFSAKRSSRYYRLYLMAAATGLRQSELCGLKWENIDPLRGRVSVQTVFYRLAGRQVWKEPKSASSRRSVPLSPELVAELREIRREQDARRKILGRLYRDHGLVFCQDDGWPLHAHNVVRRDFRRVLALDNLRAELRAQGVRAEALPKGLPRTRFHDLRHSFASLLLRHGTRMKVVQSLLGHSSIGISMDLYSHIQPVVRDEAIRVVSERLLAAHPTNESSTETVSMPRETARSGGNGMSGNPKKPQEMSTH